MNQYHRSNSKEKKSNLEKSITNTEKKKILLLVIYIEIIPKRTVLFKV